LLDDTRTLELMPLQREISFFDGGSSACRFSQHVIY
jgi:hypothetical protein